MSISNEILTVLEKYSSKKHPLTRTKIEELCKQEFPEDPGRFTVAKVRNALDNLVEADPDQKFIRYRTFSKKDDAQYRSRYYYVPLLSKQEIRFLVDSVMYSKVFNSRQALDLKDRLLSLSHQNLKDMLGYTDQDVFGPNRLTADVNVMDNIAVIDHAIKDHQLISFTFHVYVCKDGKIQLVPKEKEYRIHPVNLFLDQAKYFVNGYYPGSTQIYTFSVDLMKDIKEQVRDSTVKDEPVLRNGEWALYPLQHPFTMGGDTSVYTIRMNPDYISRLVDTFSYNIQSATEDPDGMIRVKVKSSEEGLKRWLMFHYESAQLVDDGSPQTTELKQMIKKAATELYDRYVSKEKEG